MVRVGRPLLLLFILSPLVASTQTRTDCNAIHSRILKQAVHYCVHLPAAYGSAGLKGVAPRYPVLYFLHGLGQNEQTMFETGGWTLIEDLRQRNKIGDFLIVAPEGRQSFYINSADGRVRYSDFFLEEFLPYIEHRYRIRPGRRGRAITGVSMGGYGALRFAFAHPEIFSAVSAQSAALITQPPRQLDAVEKSGAALGRLLVRAFGQPINRTHWIANSVFTLARSHAAGLRRVAIYFNCGEADDYGFEDGAGALHQELQSRGIKHEYHLYPGGHDLSYFLAHLGEVMEFHSRAFAEQK